MPFCWRRGPEWTCVPGLLCRFLRPWCRRPPPMRVAHSSHTCSREYGPTPHSQPAHASQTCSSEHGLTPHFQPT